jgi:predicted flap endonuclease-1-like 5' DNA nuclease
MMAKAIHSIEGIGPRYAEALKAAGITNTERLLQGGATREGRAALAQTTGINEKLILKWVNMSDLCRVKGVAGQYAELLEAAGVDTVRELRTRNPDNLAEAMGKLNKDKRLVRQVPNSKQVSNWVQHAKSLPPIISY